MTCSDVAALSAEYALDILPAGQVDDVSGHLARCRACRDEVAALRRVGDRLFDLVPDAEPPVGFERRVLAAVAPPSPRARQKPVVLAGLAAAAVLVVAVALYAIRPGATGPRPTELTAALVHDGRAVGSVYLGGNPPWLSMTVNGLSGATQVECQLVASNGRVTAVGAFGLVGGHGSWSAPEPIGAVHLASARLVTPDGRLLASASFVP